MSNYILAAALGKSQNRFSVSVYSGLEIKGLSPLNYFAVIDTGCAVTKLTMQTMNVSNWERFKNNDILAYKNGNVEVRPSYGVSDTEKALNISSLSDDELHNSKNVAFKHFIKSLSINGYSFGYNQYTCKLSYNQVGPSLIGMNILNKMDFHCGYSRLLKQFVFIGCLRTDINIDYLEVLSDHLGYLPNKKFIKELIDWKKIDRNDDFIQKEYSVS